jgi:hypothetical protein
VRRGRHKLANTFRGWQRSAGTETSRQKINGGSRLLCPAAVRTTLPLPSLVLICMRRLSNTGGCEGRARPGAPLCPGKRLSSWPPAWPGPRWFSCCTSSSRAGRDRRGYGVYGYAITFATLVRLFASLGSPQAALRFLPFYRVQSDWSRMRGLVQGGELLMLTTGGIATRLGPPRASTARRWKVWMHRRGASELHLRPSIVSALKPLPESRGTHA